MVILVVLSLISCNGDGDPAPELRESPSISIEALPAAPGDRITVRVTDPHAACYTLSELNADDPRFELTSDGGPEANLEAPTWYPAGQGSCEGIEVPAGVREHLVLPDVLEPGVYELCVRSRGGSDVCADLSVE